MRSRDGGGGRSFSSFSRIQTVPGGGDRGEEKKLKTKRKESKEKL